MGNSIFSTLITKYQFQHTHSVWEEWEIFKTQKPSPIYKIVKNKRNPQILGQLHTRCQVSDLQKEVSILQFRNNFKNSPIVGIWGIYKSESPQTNTMNWCARIDNYQAVTENISYCLSDIGQISLPHGMDVLKKSLMGAKLIKQQLNLCVIYDENMIFFDDQNECKIWISENINENICPFQEIKIGESQSVDSIFSCVESKIQRSQSFYNFIGFRSEFQINTYQDAIEFIERSYLDLIVINHHSDYSTLLLDSLHRSPRQQNKILKKEIKNQKKTQRRSLNLSRNINNFPRASYSNSKRNKIIQPSFCVENTSMFSMASANITLKNQSEFHSQNHFNSHLSNKKEAQLKKHMMRREELKQKFIEVRKNPEKIKSKHECSISTQNESDEIELKIPLNQKSKPINQRISFKNYQNPKIDIALQQHQRFKTSMNKQLGFLAQQNIDQLQRSTFISQKVNNDRKHHDSDRSTNVNIIVKQNAKISIRNFHEKVMKLNSLRST